MSDAVEPLILDLLEWLTSNEKTYAEALEAWRTSCPRLPVWEDATDRGLVQEEQVNGRALATVTASGRALLERSGRRPVPARRILVIDDEPEVRTLSRKMLEMAGYRVSEAASGQLAAEALMNDTFDAILTDLRMASGSGETLIQWILLNRPLLGSRILIVTGDPRAKPLLAFVSRINIPMLSKPYTRAQLLDAVAKLIRAAEPTAPSA
jgi:CheY-like chemotaxis protein